MTTNNAMASLDDLLDGTLDDLADAPAFKPFPAGAHTLKINWITDQPINEVPTVKLKLTHVETVELANPEDEPAKAGDTTEVAFMLKKKDPNDASKMIANELAQGQLKEIIASLKTGLNLETATNREVMAASEGMEVLVSTTIRTDKRDKNDLKHYTAVKSVMVV
jgi:hypothetical protein